MTDMAVRRRIVRSLSPQAGVSRKTITAREAFEVWRRSVIRTGMYPLTAPGMPLPGPNFLRYAQDKGDTESTLVKEKVDDATRKSGKSMQVVAKVGTVLEKLYLQALRVPGFRLNVELRGGVFRQVTFVPGHLWGQYYDDQRPVDGPHPADVMVIGKFPGPDEVQQLRNLVGQSGRLLNEMLQQLRVKNTPRWYLTNLLKFRPPDGTSTIRAAWLKDCLPLLHQELRIVKPRYILCLGADASKALLGEKASVTHMEGRVMEYTFPIGVSAEDPQPHTALVMTVVHPASILRAQSDARVLERGLSRFNLLQQGIRFDKAEADIKHRKVDNLPELEELLQEVEHDPDKHDSVIAVDAEWHGEHPINKGAYLRTIQFAWRPKWAAAVELTAPGGTVAFTDAAGKPAFKQAIKLLSVFFKGGTWKEHTFRRKRVVGHFFNADLEWLVHYGLDLRSEFRVPLYDLDLKDAPASKRAFYRKILKREGIKTDVIPAWLRTRYEGGADTGLMAHAVEETASYKLETLALRYTTVPRYDVPLHEWRETYCKEQGLKAGDLEGYGMCPKEILIPYGIYDADATLRLYYELYKYLDKDYEGNCCREAFWESMIAAPAVLEIHQNGILLDRPRLKFLTQEFVKAREKTAQTLAEWAKWNDEKGESIFNIRSVQHVKEFLFGERLNGRVTKEGGVVKIRPAGGKSLQLEPLLNTGKPPRLWSDLVSRGEAAQHSPSTNKAVLSILAQENDSVADQINWIRDYRFLDQVLKTVLREPKSDDDGNWIVEARDDGTDDFVYEAGLASVLCDDGRVRTHIYQTKETGRWSSARPNLQNISSQRDPDYSRLLGGVWDDEKKAWIGGGYKYKLRSLFKAAPGHLLVEVDYTGAELFGMAVMSGDKRMIEHCRRNQLPEDDPQYYDIHSNVARLAFGLECKPTKSGLKSIGKSHLRIIAKSVNL